MAALLRVAIIITIILAAPFYIAWALSQPKGN
jgi:hypothetical protein